MYLLLNFIKYSFSQYVINCNIQSDCDYDSYCNILGQCKTCDNIKYNLCDALQGCCTPDFLDQCLNNKFNCNYTNESNVF